MFYERLGMSRGYTMTATHRSPVDQAQSRALIEDRVTAVRAVDINALLSKHAPDILAFDVLDPSRYTGSATVKERAQRWVSSYRGPIGDEVRDLNITTGDDVAFCHYLYRVTGTRTDGQAIAMWVRATVCYRKIDGAWMITHEHRSVPFDSESGKASLDLTP